MNFINYHTDRPVTVEQFRDLLQASGLGERRPVEDPECLRGMLENSNLILSAWCGERLVGISRSVTDFYFVCYLSDLAVDLRFQKQGIGRELQRMTLQQLRPTCQLILLAAPAAREYYRAIGYTKQNRCWVIPPGSRPAALQNPPG